MIERLQYALPFAAFVWGGTVAEISEVPGDLARGDYLICAVLVWVAYMRRFDQ